MLRNHYKPESQRLFITYTHSLIVKNGNGLIRLAKSTHLLFLKKKKSCPSTRQIFLVDTHISHMPDVRICVVPSCAHVAYMLTLESNHCARHIIMRPVSSRMRGEGLSWGTTDNVNFERWQQQPDSYCLPFPFSEDFSRRGRHSSFSVWWHCSENNF